MRTNFFSFLIFITIVSLFTSCFKDDKEVTLSSDPSFYSLKFAKNDSIPGLERAIFTYEYDAALGDSVIVNLDSLPFQLRIDSVYPTFTFRSSAGQYLIMKDALGTGKDTVFLTGKDTIDFNRVLSIRNFATDGTPSKDYNIKVNVHQVAPEMYVWRRTVPEVYAHDASVQKVVFFKNKFFFYAGSAENNYLYTSDKALLWKSEVINGLPLNCNFTNITAFNDKLYVPHGDGKIYSSADGYTWTGLNPGNVGYIINNLLFVLDNNLWSVFKHQATQQYYFSTSTDGAVWQMKEKLPADFPIADFGAYSFTSRNNKPKAIIVGGYDADGDLLSSVWSVQKNTFDEYKWIDLGKDSKGPLTPLSGVAIVQYDDKLLLFGGMTISKGIIDRPYKESIDEGLTWKHTDTIYNVINDLSIPLSYQPRSYQSVVHDATEHNIYLFGGKTRNMVFSDVWVGKLNRLSFLR